MLFETVIYNNKKKNFLIAMGFECVSHEDKFGSSINIFHYDEAHHYLFYRALSFYTDYQVEKINIEKAQIKDS